MKIREVEYTCLNVCIALKLEKCSGNTAVKFLPILKSFEKLNTNVMPSI